MGCHQLWQKDYQRPSRHFLCSVRMSLLPFVEASFQSCWCLNSHLVRGSTYSVLKPSTNRISCQNLGERPMHVKCAHLRRSSVSQNRSHCHFQQSSLSLYSRTPTHLKQRHFGTFSKGVQIQHLSEEVRSGISLLILPAIGRAYSD